MGKQILSYFSKKIYDVGQKDPLTEAISTSTIIKELISNSVFREQMSPPQGSGKPEK